MTPSHIQREDDRGAAMPVSSADSSARVWHRQRPSAQAMRLATRASQRNAQLACFTLRLTNVRPFLHPKRADVTFANSRARYATVDLLHRIGSALLAQQLPSGSLLLSESLTTTNVVGFAQDADAFLALGASFSAALTAVAGCGFEVATYPMEREALFDARSLNCAIELDRSGGDRNRARIDFGTATDPSVDTWLGNVASRFITADGDYDPGSRGALHATARSVLTALIEAGAIEPTADGLDRLSLYPTFRRLASDCRFARLPLEQLAAQPSRHGLARLDVRGYRTLVQRAGHSGVASYRSFAAAMKRFFVRTVPQAVRAIDPEGDSLYLLLSKPDDIAVAGTVRHLQVLARTLDAAFRRLTGVGLVAGIAPVAEGASAHQLAHHVLAAIHRPEQTSAGSDSIAASSHPILLTESGA